LPHRVARRRKRLETPAFSSIQRVTKLSDTHAQGSVPSELQYTQKVAPTQAENRQKTAAPAVRRNLKLRRQCSDY
jgi:hypothetical protein